MTRHALKYFWFSIGKVHNELFYNNYKSCVAQSLRYLLLTGVNDERSQL